jgi:hypothetical protein
MLGEVGDFLEVFQSEAGHFHEIIHLTLHLEVLCMQVKGSVRGYKVINDYPYQGKDKNRHKCHEVPPLHLPYTKDETYKGHPAYYGRRIFEIGHYCYQDKKQTKEKVLQHQGFSVGILLHHVYNHLGAVEHLQAHIQYGRCRAYINLMENIQAHQYHRKDYGNHIRGHKDGNLIMEKAHEEYLDETKQGRKFKQDKPLTSQRVVFAGHYMFMV